MGDWGQLAVPDFLVLRYLCPTDARMRWCCVVTLGRVEDIQTIIGKHVLH